MKQILCLFLPFILASSVSGQKDSPSNPDNLTLLPVANSKAVDRILQTDDMAWELINQQAPIGIACLSDSMFYGFAGGGSGWTIGNETWVYNTNTNTWSQLTDMPLAMVEGGIGKIGDKIYMVAGWRNIQGTDDWIATDSILEYDIAADTFTFRQKCPIKIGSSASCVMDNKIYMFGGWGDPFPDVYYPQGAFSYDPATDTWDTLSNMLYPHLMHATAEVVDGNIYVIGGASQPGNFTPQQPEKFDGENWEPIAEMPFPVTVHKSIVHNNKILVFGGDTLWTTSKGNSTDLIQEYDPATDTWSVMEPMPFQRSGMLGGKVGNDLYLIGGFLDDRNLATYKNEVWRFNLDSLKAVNPSGIRENNMDHILLFPNPVSDYLSIKTNHSGHYSIELHTLNGQFTMMREFDGFSYQLDLTTLRKGVYFITIRSKDFVTTRKIVKL